VECKAFRVWVYQQREPPRQPPAPFRTPHAPALWSLCIRFLFFRALESPYCFEGPLFDRVLALFFWAFEMRDNKLGTCTLVTEPKPQKAKCIWSKVTQAKKSQVQFAVCSLCRGHLFWFLYVVSVVPGRCKWGIGDWGLGMRGDELQIRN